MWYHIVEKRHLGKNYCLCIIVLHIGCSKLCLRVLRLPRLCLVGGNILFRQLLHNCITLNRVQCALLRITFILKHICVSPYFIERLRKALILPHCSVVIKSSQADKAYLKSEIMRPWKQFLNVCHTMLDHVITCK